MAGYWELVYLFTVALLALVLAAVAYFTRSTNRSLELLGVRETYDSPKLSTERIDLYLKVKEQLRNEFFPNHRGIDDSWMGQLQAQSKDRLKFFLLQRAVGAIAAAHTIDIDARGLSRLFRKGVITSKFWNSVVEAEHTISQELDKVKLEALYVEPWQDPASLITDAWRIFWSNGGKVPPIDPQLGNAAAGGGHPTQQMQPGPWGPGDPRRLPPQGRPQAPSGPASGTEEGATWNQDGTEMEVHVVVPSNAKKGEIKVSFQKQALRVEHCGTVLVDGQLAGECRPQECTWTMGAGRVVVSLEKMRPAPWPALFASAS